MHNVFVHIELQRLKQECNAQSEKSALISNSSP